MVLLVVLPSGEVLLVRDLPNKVTGRRFRDILKDNFSPTSTPIGGRDLAEAFSDSYAVRDLLNRNTGRTLRYTFMPALQNQLVHVRPEEFSNLLHYDPWWLLQDRDDIPQEVRDAVVATNIADLEIDGKPLSEVYFEDTLLRVGGVRVLHRLQGSRFIRRNDLLPIFQ
jgi:hypothetical protein